MQNVFYPADPSFAIVVAGIVVALYFVAVTMVRLISAPKSAQDISRMTKPLTVVMNVIVFVAGSVGLVTLALAIVRIVGASESLLQNPIWQFSIFLHFVAVVACAVCVVVAYVLPRRWQREDSELIEQWRREDEEFERSGVANLIRKNYIS